MLFAVALLPGVAAAQLPGTGSGIPAPTTQPVDDGPGVTDGTRTLVVSQDLGLDPEGQALTVTGSGYDEGKGIYVAFCVVPEQDQTPTPCGGGMDMEGSAGASHWVSSNPPSYGVGLAEPYGPGGSFEVSINVAPAISAEVDCNVVRCAVVSRNDHQRSSDRSQDMLVPVTFAGSTLEAEVLAARSAGGSNTTTWVLVGVGVAVLAVALGGALVLRGRSRTS